MVNILQKTLSNSFSLIKIFEIWWTFHWNLHPIDNKSALNACLREKIITYLLFTSFFNTENRMPQGVEIPSQGSQEQEHLYCTHHQYYGCWWPGATRSQGISSHGIDLGHPEYSSFNASGLSRKVVSYLPPVFQESQDTSNWDETQYRRRCVHVAGRVECLSCLVTA